MRISQELDQHAQRLATQYLLSEKELFSVLIQMETRRSFSDLGYTGIYSYCIGALKFSESQAGYFSSVARKSKEVPALKEAIDKGTLTISKARRIVKVITPGTQESWIEKAATLPQKQLEREVAAADPKSVSERVRAIDYDRHEIRLGASGKMRQKLERAIALQSRSRGRRLSIEDTLEAVLDFYLERQDPIRKAGRALLRKVEAVNVTHGRQMPARVIHQVNLRDLGECQVPGCNNRVWTQVHHKVPVAQGGPNTAENLVTLCSAHHRLAHASGNFVGETKQGVGCGKLERFERQLPVHYKPHDVT